MLDIIKDYNIFTDNTISNDIRKEILTGRYRKLTLFREPGCFQLKEYRLEKPWKTCYDKIMFSLQYFARNLMSEPELSDVGLVEVIFNEKTYFRQNDRTRLIWHLINDEQFCEDIINNVKTSVLAGCY